MGTVGTPGRREDIVSIDTVAEDHHIEVLPGKVHGQTIGEVRNTETDHLEVVSIYDTVAGNVLETGLSGCRVNSGTLETTHVPDRVTSLEVSAETRTLRNGASDT